MALYRVKAGDGVAWITGASGGIGRELALEMARQGYTVAATARSEDKLAEMARESEAMKGRILAFPGDATDRNAMADIVSRIEKEAGEITLAVFNAGTYFPTSGEALHLDNFIKTYEINVFGALNGLVPVIERMKAHGRGQVAFVASVSGYSGLPAASAYGASKAALNNMAESLKFDFEKMNIRTQVVNPGFVKTPLTDKNDFDMPALVPVEKAVERIIAGLEGGGFEITFPRRFTYILKIMRMMPHPVYFAVMRKAMGWDKRPLNFRNTTPSTAKTP